MTFKHLPQEKNAGGKERRIGFELEIAGIEIEDCAKLVAEVFGGKILFKHSLKTEITGTRVGDFRVELDALVLRGLAERQEKEGDAADGLVGWINDTAGKIVPIEIVTPPMTFDQLPDLELLRQKLQVKKAQGTKAAIINAFGMHINLEVASKEVDYVRDVLRAFLILYPWLKETMGIDFSRRVLTYINPFPIDYLRLVLPETYAPSWDTFITDYLEHNPSRNRALDLLPLFMHVKPDSVKLLREADRKLIRARPTFHYRLPNCEIDSPDWRIARDWNSWVEIEKLAQNKEKLNEMASEYLAFVDKPLHMLSNEWLEKITTGFGGAS
jgi:hypothetical protein